MEKTRNKIWYHESTVVDCRIEDINKSLTDVGEHYKELISMYPGMTTVQLIEQGDDYVTIKTNEGTMKRTNIKVDRSDEKIRI